MQQGQQYCDRFLLVPGEDHRQGQVIDADTESTGQSHGDLDGRVSVIALTDVQQARNTANIAQLFVEKAELAAGEREDYRIGGGLLHKLGIVIAARFGAVAARNEEEMADGLTLDGLDDLVGHAEDRVSGKAHEHLPSLGIRRETGQGQRLVNQQLEVTVGDVGQAGPAGRAAREDVVLISVARFLDAVGRHQYGSGKFRELFGLILPGGSVVTIEMGVFFQTRIAVGRQHFTVGVDIDALALRLLEQFLQIFQVMAGDEDGLALFNPQGYACGRRVSVGSGIAGIEELHRPEIYRAALQHQAYPVVQSQVLSQGGGQPLLEEGNN